MTIGGSAASAERTFAVINPATGEEFAEAPECTQNQLDMALDAAQSAYGSWRSDLGARRAAMHAAADALFAASDEIGPILTAEQGKPLHDAKLEVLGCGVWFKYFAELDLPTEVIQDDERALVRVLRRPLGVVAAITPWNYPLVLASWKLAPALLAGNTVVLKPSPYTPLATLKMGEVLSAALPPGVLNVVSGGDDLGRWMSAHPLVRKVSFTGSVRAGKQVAASAATDLKRVTLELGGNDAAILLDDVDPAAIAEKLFWGAFQNNGQVCVAVKRVYAPEAIYDDVVESLAEQARAVKVGDGMTEGVQLGPINNRPQFERVKALVSDALERGARAVAGGHPIEGPGYFFEPTILAGVLDGCPIVDEEQFGPALPVIPYQNLDDAVEQANATHFGLSGSVWSTDTDRAETIATRLECGTAWVNSHGVLQPHQPFGGTKWSGMGVENGPWGLYGFTELQVLYTPTS
jgi:acyl-CoA reductase-like NAD-dependent aldehyde dehydrogenase